MIINLIYDAAALAAPASFRNTIQQAANILDAMITDNITVNINIDYSGSGGGALGGPDNGQFVAYSSVYNYLIQSASPGDSSFDYLPVPGSANAPSSVVVWNAQLKAMGLLSPNSTSTDDGLARFAVDINPNLLLGVALHELTHAMGRVPYGAADIMELDRFSSAGNRVYDGSVPAHEASYFSVNGGLSAWAQYGVNSDPSDFLNSVNYGGDGTSTLTANDAFNQFYTSNTLQYLTPADLEQLDILGFHLKFDAPAEDAYDFNGKNSGDILLQSAGGQIEYANMAGGSFQGMVSLATVPGWTVVGAGKISGGVDSDFVIQNSSGLIVYGNVVNGTLSNFVQVTNAPGYGIVGVADVNDDHYADIIVQDPNTYEIAYANMHNGVFNNWVVVGSTPGWAVKGVADINYDGFADVVIQNQSTSEIAYANMANGVFNNWVAIAQTPGFNVVGLGDIDRLGDADVVVQNPNTGQVAYAVIKNGALSNFVSIGSVPGWNVIAVEDILGNGYNDIVIQNSSSGQILYANMTGGSFQGWVNITTPPSGFVGKTGPGVGDSSAGVAGAMSQSVTASADTPTGSAPFGAGVDIAQSASWLTEGGLPGGSSTNYAQSPASGTSPPISVDLLQHVLTPAT